LFLKECERLLDVVRSAGTVAEAREKLFMQVSEDQLLTFQEGTDLSDPSLSIVRDCARAFRSMSKERSEVRAGFSLIEALHDIAHGRERPDIGPGFYAELVHLVMGLEGRSRICTPDEHHEECDLTGREAALQRSDDLDRIWIGVESAMDRYSDGMSPDSISRRAARRAAVIQALGASSRDFDNWRWQRDNIADGSASLERIVPLRRFEKDSIAEARKGRLPFGVTPYYASLMDEDPRAGRDRALRAQVIPPADYVERMLENRGSRECAFDFMLERDTSPVNLVTRRYPAIMILKPFNTCPQICVYCQRNWEIENVMAPDALPRSEDLDRAIEFIREHPAMREILITGGDPLALEDDPLLEILGRIAGIPHVDLIRIGTRTPVTMPMRITEALAGELGKLRDPGRREVCLVTHVEHVYEITPELVQAVDRLKRRGISVFNQLVFTFFNSRRFESAKLRMLLRRAGIDPYYTFMAKGKEETDVYRVPLARLMQEQKEEARLLPGTRRTDEAVYNVPGLGKNYLRAFQHRDILSILPDGSRVYDFHPWEKGIALREAYTGKDIPVLNYLEQLEKIGENPYDYESIWHYF